jgi:hypothetical protein
VVTTFCTLPKLNPVFPTIPSSTWQTKKPLLLLTADKDFGEIFFRENRLISDGIVLLRLAGLSPEKKAEIVTDTIRRHAAEFPHHFSVIAPGKTRIRSKDS